MTTVSPSIPSLHVPHNTPPYTMPSTIQPLRIKRTKGRLQIKKSTDGSKEDASSLSTGSGVEEQATLGAYSVAAPPFDSIAPLMVPDYGSSSIPSLSTVTKTTLSAHSSPHGLGFLPDTPSGPSPTVEQPSTTPSGDTSTSSHLGSPSGPESTSNHLDQSNSSLDSPRPRISRQHSRVRFSDELDVKIYSRGSQGLDDRVSSSSVLSVPRRSPEPAQVSPKPSTVLTDFHPSTGADTMGNNLREFRSSLRASSSKRTMTSSSSLSTLPSVPSTNLTIPSSFSLTNMDKLDSGDDFSPRSLRYPRLSKSMARLSQTSTRSSPARSHGKSRSAKSSPSPKSMTLSIPPTPRSAGFSVPPTPNSAPLTSSRSPRTAPPSGHDLRDVLQRATLALASSPSKRSPSYTSSANGSIRSKASKRDSFASIASTLFSTDGSVMTEGSSTMSTSTSSTSITSSTLSTEGGQNQLTTPKALKIWTSDVHDHDSDGADEVPLGGLYGFPLPPTSTPVRSKTFPSTPSVTPSAPVPHTKHQRTDSNLSAILDWTPSRHIRTDSSLSFVHDFPIPPSRPTLQVVIADIDSPDRRIVALDSPENKRVPSFDTPDAKRVLSYEPPRPEGTSTPLKVVEAEESEETPRPKASAVMDSLAYVEEPTMLPYLTGLAPSATLDDGAESDLDLSAPLMDVALRSNIISPNSRLNRFSLSSRRSSDGGHTISPGSPMYRTTSTPGSSRSSYSSRSSRSSVRSSTTTLRPLSLSSRHSGEGWSGSESEEEEFISAIQSISIRRLSTPRLKRIPSLMARPRPLRSTTSPAGLSPRIHTRALGEERTSPRSPLAEGSSPRTPASRSALVRLSGQSQLSNSTCSEVESALLTPCPSGDTISSKDLPSPTKSKDGDPLDDPLPGKDRELVKLPRPTRRVEGWGMPEILIDEEWSSGDERRPWSSDEEFDREMEVKMRQVTEPGGWLLSEEL